MRRDRPVIHLPVRFIAHEGGFTLLTDHRNASEYIASVEEDGTTRIQSVMYHDVFHHAALGLDYTDRDELLTAYLDRQYPWYSSNSEALKEEITKLAELLPVGERPSRWEIAKLRKLARSRLGYLRPRSYRKPFERAIAAYLAAGPAVAKATLVVDVTSRQVTLLPRKTRRQETAIAA